MSAAVVGIVLTVVNHGPQLIAGQMSAALVAQIGLTAIVPFLVSCASSVAAIRERERTGDAPLA